MTRDMRRKNLKGAFEVKPNKVHALEGKNVILIDNVITTVLMMLLPPDRQ